MPMLTGRKTDGGAFSKPAGCLAGALGQGRGRLVAGSRLSLRGRARLRHHRRHSTRRLLGATWAAGPTGGHVHPNAGVHEVVLEPAADLRGQVPASGGQVAGAGTGNHEGIEDLVHGRHGAGPGKREKGTENF